MVLQFSTSARNAALDAIETHVGTAPTLEVRTGAPPATPATADSGTLLATLTLPSDWMAAASGGTKALAGTWQVNAGASGAPGHFRIKQAGSPFTVHVQGTAGPQTSLTTSSATAANSNVLNFASTTGVQVGHRVSGTGIPDDTYVLAVGASTVTLSRACPAGVSGATGIAFRPDMVTDNATLNAGQQFTVTSFSLNSGGA